MKRIFISLALLILTSPLFAQQMWSVDDCMRYAVKNSPLSMRQALTQDNARRDLLGSKMGFLPSISGSTSFNSNFGRSIDPETNTYASVSNMSNNYSVSGSVYLFNGLSVVNTYKIASVSVLREESESKRVNDQLSLETMKAYYAAVFANGALQIAKEELTESRNNYNKGRVEYEIGLKNMSDLAQLESSVSQKEYNVINLDGEYKKSLLSLKDKMFFPIEESLVIDTVSSAVMATVSSENISEISRIALDLMPEIKIAEFDMKKSKLKYSTAKGQLFPTISANGGLSTGYSKVMGSDAVQKGYRDQLRDRLGEYVGISLNVPIFQNLNRQMNVKRTRNEYSRAEISLKENIRKIEKSVAEAVIDLESFEKQCNQSEINVKANQLSYNTTHAKYDEGLSSVIDLQTTQTNLSRAKVEQLESSLRYVMQRRVVDYYKGTPLIR